MKRHLEAEEQFMKAIQFYSTYFPHSFEYAACLGSLGGLYGNIGRREEASATLKEARRLLEKVGTQSELDECDHQLQSLGID